MQALRGGKLLLTPHVAWASDEARITSYNVCYTKLLRVDAGVLLGGHGGDGLIQLGVGDLQTLLIRQLSYNFV